MEAIIAFLAGIVAAWVYVAASEPKPQPPLAIGEVPARLENIYATAHLDTGDFEVRSLRRLKGAGNLFTFEIFIPSVPFKGTLEGTTIHLGDQSQRVSISRSFVNVGDSLTIFQPVTFTL